MKSMVLGHHPTDEPIQDISLLINLIELKDATSTQVAQLLGVSPFLLSRFLRNLSYGHYTDKLKGSQRLIAFTVEGAQQIIDMRDRHNAQKNKEPVEIRKKNKPEQNISYTEFMKGIGNLRGLVYRLAWSHIQKAHLQFFIKIGRTFTLRPDFYKEALGEFNKHLAQIEAQKRVGVEKNTSKKAQRRILNPDKYATTIIRQAGDRL